MDPARCPADTEEVAEAYVMDGLPDADAAVFEEHLLICARCRDAVQAADVYVGAIRVVAGQLRQAQKA